MSIKVISIKEDGVHTVDFEDLSKDDLIDIELALMTRDPNDRTLSCVKCYALFEGGTGHNKCPKCR